MSEANGRQLSLNELLSKLYAGRKEAIARGSDAGYSELIAAVNAWHEDKRKHRFPVDPNERKSIGYWYGEFDQLSFFIRSNSL